MCLLVNIYVYLAVPAYCENMLLFYLLDEVRFSIVVVGFFPSVGEFTGPRFGRRNPRSGLSQVTETSEEHS